VSFFDPTNYGSNTGPEGQAPAGLFGSDHPPAFAERPMEAVMVFLSHVRSVGVAYLLGLTFGPIGAHRLYLRKIRSGMAMALLTLVSIASLSGHDQSAFRLPRDLAYLVAPFVLAAWLVIDLIFLAEAVRIFNSGLRTRIIAGKEA
jgi:hypothetical protein